MSYVQAEYMHDKLKYNFRKFFSKLIVQIILQIFFFQPLSLFFIVQEIVKPVLSIKVRSSTFVVTKLILNC